jgi:hypothetical protein
MPRSKKEICLIAGLSLAGISISPAFAGSYIFSTITHPDETYSYASSVNDWGTVVGSYNTSASRVRRNFAWFEGKSTPLPKTITPVTSINNQNVIAGTIGSSPDTTTVLLHAFTGKFARIPIESGYHSYPTAIDDSSNVVGFASNPPVSVGFVSMGFVSNGVATSYLTPPGDYKDSTASFISDSGVVYGAYAGKLRNTHEFYFQNGTYTDFFPPGDITAVVSAGAFAGSYAKSVSGKPVLFGYTRQQGKTKSYLYPGSSYTQIIGFAPRGALIGKYEDGNGAYGFFVTFKGVYYPLSFPGAASTWITGVSTTRGNLAGYYTDNAGAFHAFVATCPVAASPCTQ